MAETSARFDKKTLLKLRARFLRALWPTLFVLLCFYIFKQGVWGERGVFTWQTLRQQVHMLEQENVALRQYMTSLEREADRLSGDDPDAIEMEIRASLPLLRPHEYLIMLPAQATAAE